MEGSTRSLRKSGAAQRSRPESNPAKRLRRDTPDASFKHACLRLRRTRAGADIRRNRHFENQVPKTTLSEAAGDVFSTRPNPQHPRFGFTYGESLVTYPVASPEFPMLGACRDPTEIHCVEHLASAG